MNERFADPIDEAAALEASMTESAIALARRANTPEFHPDFDGETCIECGNEIPLGRLAMAKIRCVHCQRATELRARQRGR